MASKPPGAYTRTSVLDTRRLKSLRLDYDAEGKKYNLLSEIIAVPDDDWETKRRFNALFAFQPFPAVGVKNHAWWWEDTAPLVDDSVRLIEITFSTHNTDALRSRFHPPPASRRNKFKRHKISVVFAVICDVFYPLCARYKKEQFHITEKENASGPTSEIPIIYTKEYTIKERVVTFDTASHDHLHELFKPLDIPVDKEHKVSTVLSHLPRDIPVELNDTYNALVLATSRTVSRNVKNVAKSILKTAEKAVNGGVIPSILAWKKLAAARIFKNTEDVRWKEATLYSVSLPGSKLLPQTKFNSCLKWAIRSQFCASSFSSPKNVAIWNSVLQKAESYNAACFIALFLSLKTVAARMLYDGTNGVVSSHADPYAAALHACVTSHIRDVADVLWNFVVAEGYANHDTELFDVADQEWWLWRVMTSVTSVSFVTQTKKNLSTIRGSIVLFRYFLDFIFAAEEYVFVPGDKEFGERCCTFLYKYVCFGMNYNNGTAILDAARARISSFPENIAAGIRKIPELKPLVINEGSSIWNLAALCYTVPCPNSILIRSKGLSHFGRFNVSLGEDIYRSVGPSEADYLAAYYNYLKELTQKAINQLEQWFHKL